MDYIPHHKNPSAKTTDDKNKGKLTAQNLSQSDKLNGKAANYFFWPILASGINLIVNLVEIPFLSIIFFYYRFEFASRRIYLLNYL